MVRASLIFWVTAAAVSAQSNTVYVQVSNQLSPQAGLNGRLQLGMSTSFQLAYPSYPVFDPAPLSALYPQHTRVQALAAGLPLTAPDTWNFAGLDAIMPLVQGAGDHSPELQIGSMPPFMNGSFVDFAQMSANLVQYYNTGGFYSGGMHFQSPSPYPVTWWGILNEPNGTGMSAEQYTSLYNTVVPAMALVDPSIQFAAIELSDIGTAAEGYLPAFAANVTAPVNAVATHFYSTCDQQTLDNTVLATVLGFASEVRYIYSELAQQPALAAVPVWVTENNVNSDYDAGNGMSYCNPGQPFVADPRGTSAFFAAWRSLVFVELGEAGAQALYHWTYSGNTQFGEVDSSGNPYLSYWVDYYLSHWLPSPPGQDILQVAASGCCLWIDDGSNPLGLDTHTLAARNPDGSVVVLMSNHAVNNPKDDNGSGAARTFALDLPALGSFSSATLVMLDNQTPAGGPAPISLTPSSQMNVVLPGYGAALLRLANAQPAVIASGAVNAASYRSGPVAPGEILALFGTAIGPIEPAGLTLTNPKLAANSAAGLHVLFDGVPAPILYASDRQVNVVVPYAVAGHASTQLQVDYLGAVSAPLTLPVAATAPGIFTLNGSGAGPGAILDAKDETVNSPANPAAPGDWVSLFATGAGVTTPAGVDGLVASAPLPQANAPVEVTMGGLPCPINYAGAAPGDVAGVLQINAQVPAGVVPGGAVPIQVKIGTAYSQTGVTLAVK